MSPATKVRFLLIYLCLLTLPTTQLSATSSSDRGTIAKANALVHAGQVPQAESLLRAASNADPGSELLHEALGELFYEQRKFEDAVRELTLAIQINPDSRHYSFMLAGALINWQHFGVAADFLNAVLPRFGQYPEFHYYLGIAYYNMNRIPDAVSELQQTIHISPGYDRAQFLLAYCYLSQADNGKALAIYRDLVKERPANPIYWATLAETLTNLGDKNETESLRAGRKALTLAPDNRMALSATGLVLTRMGDFAGARPLYERLAHLDPDAIAPHAALARIYARLAKPDLAQAEAETISRLQAQTAPSNPQFPAPPANLQPY